jgi:3-isopropylmalate/(R)-2-methylmalate dehydratase small subunit
MSLPNIQGRVAWIFTEDDFDVDQIIGVKNIKISDIDELSGLAMQSYDPQFKALVRAGDVLVGGRNFGYGHPHYPPLRAMRHLGIKALIAESFSPGFWRGEISMGFPLVSCPGILAAVQRWDDVTIDWQRSRLVNHRSAAELEFAPLSVADRGMIEQGGLIGYLQQRNRQTQTG